MGSGIARRARAMGVVAAAVTLGVASVAFAATPYQYTSVADSAGPLGTLFGEHALSNSGSDAFVNLRDDGQYGLYRWNGSSNQLVAETGPAVPGWGSVITSVGINSADQVSFFSQRVASASAVYGGIYRANANNSFTNIHEVSASQNTNGYAIGSDINASGTVAYQRRVTGTSKGIYTSNGSGAEQTIFVGAHTDTLGWWSINSSGHVAIAGTIGGAKGVWLGTGNGSIAPVATGGSFTDFRSPVLDDDGFVTFGGTLSDGTTGVWRGNGSGAATALVDSTGGTFTGNFVRTSANNDGDIAFMATPTGGGTAGLYFLAEGANPADAQRVVGIGDALFGSTISSFILAPRGLNDTDSIAFSYNLSNGTRGLAVASVPEPTSCLGASLLAVAALTRRRRA